MAQFIVDLNASMPAPERFIVRMVDPTHMYVLPHVGVMIKSKVEEFRKMNSYKPKWRIEDPSSSKDIYALDRAHVHVLQ